jgi:hypothetical protein
LEELVGYAEILCDLGGYAGIALLAIFLESPDSHHLAPGVPGAS